MFTDGFDNVDRALAAGVTAVVGYNDLVAYGSLGPGFTSAGYGFRRMSA